MHDRAVRQQGTVTVRQNFDGTIRQLYCGGPMTAPRACPDAWSAVEDEVCASFAGRESTGWWFVVASILAAGALGAGLVWVVLKWTGWLQP